MNNFTQKITGILSLLLITSASTFAQALPIDFETEITTADFVDFDGGMATVIDNPQANGINTSSKVAQIVRDGGEIWGGSKIILSDNLDFTSMNSISMKVFTTTPVGTIVKFKLESEAGAAEMDMSTTVSNEWETITWDFTAQPNIFNEVVFMFDFGNVGNGSSSSTFLFDDVQQNFSGAQIDFPVDFESETVNYALTDFGGTSSQLVTDPTDATNMVIQTIKTTEAATWAGTTIGTPAGFASNIPLTATNSKMNVRVWSPDAGIPVRLKVEDANDPTHTCETQTNTTVAEGWETIEFDFANEAEGTVSLSEGLQMGWTYNMASIFFNFGTEGVDAGEKTYYFDDVKFGAAETNVGNSILSNELLNVFPNPSQNSWNIALENTLISQVAIFDIQGKLVLSLTPNTENITIDATNLPSGTYIAKLTSNLGTNMVSLVKN